MDGEYATDSPALVTGASGFIGARIVSALRAAGRPVRVATTNIDSARARLPPDIAVVAADLSDAASLKRAVKGCALVFHVAHQFGRGGAAKVNIDGTRALAEAACAGKAERFVYFSSMAAYGPPRDGPLTEESPPILDGDAYAQTKRACEKLLADMAPDGLRHAVLQPTIVYGPRGAHWTQRIVDEVRRSRVALPAMGQGLCNAVYVDDVAAAAVLAATRSEAVGQTFLISGAAPVTWGEFYGAFARAADGKGVEPMESAAFAAAARRRYGPNAFVGKVLRRLERQVGGPRGLAYPDPGAQGLYASKMDVSIDKARRLLGYAPTFDFAAGMVETERWIRKSAL